MDESSCQPNTEASGRGFRSGRQKQQQQTGKAGSSDLYHYCPSKSAGRGKAVIMNPETRRWACGGREWRRKGEGEEGRREKGRGEEGEGEDEI